MAAHGLDNCVAVLERWGKLSNKPMPRDWAPFLSGNSTEALSITARDPILVSLLDGSANGTLRASAIRGSLDPMPPDPVKVKAERLQREAQELFDKGRDHQLTLTEEMRLAALKPDALQLLKEQYANKQVSVDEQNRFQLQMDRNEARIASRNR